MYAYSDLDSNYENKYSKKYKYNLYAVVSHLGESGAGHYVTQVKYNFVTTSHWVLFDGPKYC